MLAKLLMNLGVKLLTEKLLVAILLHIADHLVKKTSNDLDDKLVQEVKKALVGEGS